MDIPSLVFGILLAAGGSMGYAKKKSVPSLAAGGSSGLFFMYAASDVSAHATTLKAVSTLLFVVMGYRSSKSGKFMPAGMVATLSGCMALYYLFNL